MPFESSLRRLFEKKKKTCVVTSDVWLVVVWLTILQVFLSISSLAREHFMQAV